MLDGIFFLFCSVVISKERECGNIYEDEVLGVLCNCKRILVDRWVGWGDIRG